MEAQGELTEFDGGETLQWAAHSSEYATAGCLKQPGLRSGRTVEEKAIVLAQHDAWTQLSASFNLQYLTQTCWLSIDGM